MPTMNQVFHKVAWHLIKQKRQSKFDAAAVARHIRECRRLTLPVTPLPSVGTCAYRGARGRKCAVGVLIPDSKYTPSMEGFQFFSIVCSYPLLPAWMREYKMHRMISSLQLAHDEDRHWDTRPDPARFNRRGMAYLEDIARAYDIVMSARLAKHAKLMSK